MSTLSHLELVPLHRPGGGNRTERWSWDFVIDGQSLAKQVGGDIVGALGWGDQPGEAHTVEKLLGRAAPDLAPDRVSLYVCPECGDLGCGAVTASLARQGELVIWRDFAWQRDWDAPDHDQLIEMGPFAFDRGAYGRLLRAALTVRPSAGALPLAAS